MALPGAQSLSYQWQKAHQGSWERVLDECEMFYRVAAKNKQGGFPVTGYASFVSSLAQTTIVDERRFETSLRKAWRMLRCMHPSLGSHMESYGQNGEYEKRVYSPFRDGAEEEEWVQSTFRVVDCDGDILESFNNGMPLSKVPNIYLLNIAETDRTIHTVFLQCPHDVTDGIGILQLVDQLFRNAALADEQGSHYVIPAYDEEWERLSPSLRAAAAISEPSSALLKRFGEVQAQNANVYTHPQLLGLRPSVTTTPSITHRIQRVAISTSRPTTERILSRCKSVAPGVNITHIFTSALALTLSKLQPHPKETCSARYASHSMINLRPYCHFPWNGPEHAAAAYHTVSAQALGIDVTIPGSDDTDEELNIVDEFHRIAVEVRDFYKTIRPKRPSPDDDNTDEQVALTPLSFKALTPPPSDTSHTSPPISGTTFCPVSLSSIGNIATLVGGKHGPFELRNVWAASEPIGAGVALFLGCWDGRVELAATFDRGVHEDVYLRGFLEKIVRFVCVGLEIEES